jgi:uncharacterized repeat protein (TIGR04076 family)
MRERRTMERRRFLSACGLAGAAMAGAGAAADAGQAQASKPQLAPARPGYRIDIEIVECKAGSCVQHTVGDKFLYPVDRGRICPWLMDSMNAAIRVLEFGGTMPWLYEGTRHKKVIDPSGVTTEFIRCPDPTDSGVVAKITRTRVSTV